MPRPKSTRGGPRVRGGGVAAIGGGGEDRAAALAMRDAEKAEQAAEAEVAGSSSAAAPEGEHLPPAYVEPMSAEAMSSADTHGQLSAALRLTTARSPDVFERALEGGHLYYLFKEVGATDKTWFNSQPGKVPPATQAALQLFEVRQAFEVAWWQQGETFRLSGVDEADRQEHADKLRAAAPPAEQKPKGGAPGVDANGSTPAAPSADESKQIEVDDEPPRSAFVPSPALGSGDGAPLSPLRHPSPPPTVLSLLDHPPSLPAPQPQLPLRFDGAVPSAGALGAAAVGGAPDDEQGDEDDDDFRMDVPFDPGSLGLRSRGLHSEARSSSFAAEAKSEREEKSAFRSPEAANAMQDIEAGPRAQTSESMHAAADEPMGQSPLPSSAAPSASVTTALTPARPRRQPLPCAPTSASARCTICDLPHPPQWCSSPLPPGESGQLLQCATCCVVVHASCYGVAVLPFLGSKWWCSVCDRSGLQRHELPGGLASQENSGREAERKAARRAGPAVLETWEANVCPDQQWMFDARQVKCWICTYKGGALMPIQHEFNYIHMVCARYLEAHLLPAWPSAPIRFVYVQKEITMKETSRKGTLITCDVCQLERFSYCAPCGYPGCTKRLHPPCARAAHCRFDATPPKREGDPWKHFLLCRKHTRQAAAEGATSADDESSETDGEEKKEKETIKRKPATTRTKAKPKAKTKSAKKESLVSAATDASIESATPLEEEIEGRNPRRTHRKPKRFVSSSESDVSPTIEPRRLAQPQTQASTPMETEPTAPPAAPVAAASVPPVAPIALAIAPAAAAPAVAPVTLAPARKRKVIEILSDDDDEPTPSAPNGKPKVFNSTAASASVAPKKRKKIIVSSSSDSSSSSSSSSSDSSSGTSDSSASVSSSSSSSSDSDESASRRRRRVRRSRGRARYRLDSDESTDRSHSSDEASTEEEGGAVPGAAPRVKGRKGKLHRKEKQRRDEQLKHLDDMSPAFRTLLNPDKPPTSSEAMRMVRMASTMLEKRCCAILLFGGEQRDFPVPPLQMLSRRARCTFWFSAQRQTEQPTILAILARWITEDPLYASNLATETIGSYPRTHPVHAYLDLLGNIVQGLANSFRFWSTHLCQSQSRIAEGSTPYLGLPSDTQQTLFKLHADHEAKLVAMLKRLQSPTGPSHAGVQNNAAQLKDALMTGSGARVTLSEGERAAIQLRSGKKTKGQLADAATAAATATPASKAPSASAPSKPGQPKAKESDAANDAPPVLSPKVRQIIDEIHALRAGPPADCISPEQQQAWRVEAAKKRRRLKQLLTKAQKYVLKQEWKHQLQLELEAKEQQRKAAKHAKRAAKRAAHQASAVPPPKAAAPAAKVAPGKELTTGKPTTAPAPATSEKKDKKPAAAAVKNDAPPKKVAAAAAAANLPAKDKSTTPAAPKPRPSLLTPPPTTATFPYILFCVRIPPTGLTPADQQRWLSAASRLDKQYVKQLSEDERRIWAEEKRAWKVGRPKTDHQRQEREAQHAKMALAQMPPSALLLTNDALAPSKSTPAAAATSSKFTAPRPPPVPAATVAPSTRHPYLAGPSPSPVASVTPPAPLRGDHALAMAFPRDFAAASGVRAPVGVDAYANPFLSQPTVLDDLARAYVPMTAGYMGLASQPQPPLYPSYTNGGLSNEVPMSAFDPATALHPPAYADGWRAAPSSAYDVATSMEVGDDDMPPLER